MPDLMNNATYTYQSLADKYSNFMVPAVEIIVQGNDIRLALDVVVVSLTVIQALDSAGSCNFTLLNASNDMNSLFSGKVLDKLKLGAAISVKMGYGSSKSAVFDGFISEVTLRYSGAAFLEITAMDVRKLMMADRENVRSIRKDTYSGVFKQIMQKYGSLCPTLVVDSTQGEMRLEGPLQGISDFRFVMEKLAPRADREFFVLSNVAYFRIRRCIKKPVISLSFGEGLMSFSRSASYLSANLEVRGSAEWTGKPPVGKTTTKTTETMTAATAPQYVFIYDPDIATDNDANLRARVKAERMLNESMTASGSCIGLPELIPGRYVRIGALGDSMNKNYYMTKVVHEFSESGYVTEFEVEGWE
jgi:phage protein D